MLHPDFKFLRAVTMMIGAVIGVGVFGIPFAFAQSGVAIGLVELLLLGVVMIILQFMFAEISLQTEGKHRLVGYIELYLGRFWKHIATAAVCVNAWGAMLAYMIVGGSFLHVLFGSVFGGSLSWYAFVISLIGGIFIYWGLQAASRLELFVVGSLLFLFVFMILLSVPHVQLANLQSMHWENAFLPYGIILFALSSVGIVPEMKEVLGARAKSQLGSAIMIGMVTVIVLYALFAASIVGVTGSQTTQTAFAGLTSVFGNGFRYVTAVLGSLTVVSIFIMLGITLQNTFQIDFNCSRRAAWVMTVLVPIAFFACGFREFASMIGFIGSVFGGLLGLLIVLTYLKIKNGAICRMHHCLNFPNVLSWIVFSVFLVGILFKLFQFLV